MQSYHSYYKGLYAKIIEALKESDIPLSPKQITIRINMKYPLEHIKHATVRRYCRNLTIESIIENPFYGVYSVTKVRDGVTTGFSGVLVHCVVLVFEGLPVVRHDEVCEMVDGAKVSVCFGVQNRKVDCRISCDDGMALFLFRKCMNSVKQIVWDRIGVNIDVLEPTVCCEFNEDYSQYRMDGVKCVTTKSFFGDIERIYNKGKGLRSEVKVQKTDLATIYATLKGGISVGNIMQAQLDILKELREIKEAMKFNNRLQLQSLNERNGVA